MELDEVIRQLAELRAIHGNVRVLAGYQEIVSIGHNGAISEEAEYINISLEG